MAVNTQRSTQLFHGEEWNFFTFCDAWYEDLEVRRSSLAVAAKSMVPLLGCAHSITAHGPFVTKCKNLRLRSLIGTGNRSTIPAPWIGTSAK